MERSLLWKILQIPARILSTYLFDLKVYGIENVPTSGAVLLVANHQSNLDPVLVAVRLRRPVSFMAKSQLFENRWLGWLIRALHAYPIRQNEGDIGAIRQAIQRLGQGYALNVYPEGTRSLDGTIGPLQKGIALIIRKVDVPVIPIAIDGSFGAWPKGRKFIRSNPVHLMYGKPIYFRGLGANEIVETLHASMVKLLEELKQKNYLD